jgi:hypothetical protein
MNRIIIDLFLLNVEMHLYLTWLALSHVRVGAWVMRIDRVLVFKV